MQIARVVRERLKRTGVIDDKARPSRRDLLAPAAIFAAMWENAARAGESAKLTIDPNRWLVGHITDGLTETQVNLANSLGYQGYLEHHLNHTAIDDSALDARLTPTNYPTLFMLPEELVSANAGQCRNELTEAKILRSVFSNRQLFERMVEFWTDHFNIDITNGLDQQLKTVDDRDVVRVHALGTFPALLNASAQSPAMLYYLDNVVSLAANPNENYARELMELHTLGVDGGYTQQDVHEVARCFTGWGMYPNNAGTNSWHFRYLAGQHDNAQKIVLGNVIPAGGGMNDGLTVLNILAGHTNTANFIARKLSKWLLGYDPPQSLIDAVAATYLNPPPPATLGDIKSMIRTILLSTEAMAGTILKYKRPYHQMMSALRGTGATVTSTSTIRTIHLTGAGQLPYSWQPPDGYPDTLDYWVGLILPRWNFGASLLNGNIGGASVDINVLLAGTTTAAAVMDRIEIAMFGGIGGMNPAERALIQNYLLPDPPTTSRKRDAVGLAIGSPSFQWY